MANFLIIVNKGTHNPEYVNLDNQEEILKYFIIIFLFELKKNWQIAGRHV